MPINDIYTPEERKLLTYISTSKTGVPRETLVNKFGNDAFIFLSQAQDIKNPSGNEPDKYILSESGRKWLNSHQL